MKEQDAAHSFEKQTCPTCGNLWGDDNGKFCSNSWHLATPHIMRELTRLRSDLQQERDRIRTLHQTLIARFYNDQLFNKDSLSKIIDEVGDLLK